MTKVPMSAEKWFIGVARKGGGEIPTDARTQAVLRAAGCADIEVLGSGTAQARIPSGWVDHIEKNGGWRSTATVHHVIYVIDIDLP